jgi:hypothetical protein
MIPFITSATPSILPRLFWTSRAIRCIPQGSNYVIGRLLTIVGDDRYFWKGDIGEKRCLHVKIGIEFPNKERQQNEQNWLEEITVIAFILHCPWILEPKHKPYHPDHNYLILKISQKV